MECIQNQMEEKQKIEKNTQKNGSSFLSYAIF